MRPELSLLPGFGEVFWHHILGLFSYVTLYPRGSQTNLARVFGDITLESFINLGQSYHSTIVSFHRQKHHTRIRNASMDIFGIMQT